MTQILKNYIELRSLQFLCAFSLAQEAICYFSILSVDFTLKNFSGLRHFIHFDKT